MVILTADFDLAKRVFALNGVKEAGKSEKPVGNEISAMRLAFGPACRQCLQWEAGFSTDIDQGLSPPPK